MSKRILHRNWGVIGSHGLLFLVSDRLWRAKIGVPPQKNLKEFPEIFCQRIDRKSQEELMLGHKASIDVEIKFGSM